MTQRILVALLVFSLFSCVTTAEKSRRLIALEPEAPAGVKGVADAIGNVQALEIAVPVAPGVICAGRLEHGPLARLLAERGVTVDRSALGEEGYVIKTIRRDGRPLIVVAANEWSGVHYGLRDLADRLAESPLEDHFDEDRFDVVERPLFSFRGGGRRANFAFEWVCTPVNNYFSYGEFPEFFASAEERRQRMEEVAKNQATLGRHLAETESAGGRLYVLTYQPTVPIWATAALEKTHPDALCSMGRMCRNLCPAAPLTRSIMESQFREIFRKFPTLAGVILTFGDGGAEITSQCDRCRDYPVRQRIVDYTLLVRKTIRTINPRARVLIRSWSIPPEVFRSLPDLLPDDVFFMFKLSSPPCVDYAWGDRYSPFLEMRRSLVEGTTNYHTDSRRHVSHLCYTGPRQKARALALRAKGVSGIWGGSIPPERDVLDDFNFDAEDEVAWDPEKFDPDRFIERWASRRFKNRDVGLLVADALKETSKITESFIIDDLQPGTFHMSRFDPSAKGGYETALVQPAAIRDLDAKTLPDVLHRYEIAEAEVIARKAERKLAEALALVPRDADLQRLHTMARATIYLVLLFREYHWALIDHTVGDRERAEEHILKAMAAMDSYHEIFLRLHPELLTTRNWKDLAWPLRHHCVYLTFTREEVMEGYTRIVMARKAEGYLSPVWTIGGNVDAIRTVQDLPASAKAILDVTGRSSMTEAVALHPERRPSVTVKFSADLSRGGMITFAMKELGDALFLGDPNPGGKPPMDHTWNRMKFDVLLDSRAVGSIHEMGHRLCRYEPTRHLELPPTPGKEHTLTLTASDGTGILFRRIVLQTNDE